jgi:peptidoglycan/LPS O-acetylase OafA/YrhL
MDTLGSRITPEETDLSRFWVSIGTTTLMFGVFFSHNARRFLSMRLFNFLGRCSFPVYLLHNSLIRSILVWAVYGPAASHAEPLEDAGFRTVVKRVPTFALMFILPLFYALLYIVAFGWTVYVDPLCARVIDGMKNRMFKEQGNGTLLGKPELPLFHD